MGSTCSVDYKTNENKEIASVCTDPSGRRRATRERAADKQQQCALALGTLQIISRGRGITKSLIINVSKQIRGECQMTGDERTVNGQALSHDGATVQSHDMSTSARLPSNNEYSHDINGHQANATGIGALARRFPMSERQPTPGTPKQLANTPYSIGMVIQHMQMHNDVSLRRHMTIGYS
jgi:hypothetical protein